MFKGEEEEIVGENLFYWIEWKYKNEKSEYKIRCGLFYGLLESFIGLESLSF